jgi:hypothetical protein
MIRHKTVKDYEEILKSILESVERLKHKDVGVMYAEGEYWSLKEIDSHLKDLIEVQ